MHPVPILHKRMTVMTLMTGLTDVIEVITVNEVNNPPAPDRRRKPEMNTAAHPFATGCKSVLQRSCRLKAERPTGGRPSVCRSAFRRQLLLNRRASPPRNLRPPVRHPFYAPFSGL